MKAFDDETARFRAFLPRRMEVAAVAKLLPVGDLPRMACLDVGAPDPVFSQRLRSLGGACTNGKTKLAKASPLLTWKNSVFEAVCV